MMVMPKVLFLLLILSSSATNLFALSSSVEQNNHVNSYSNRLLTYACSSKDGGGRRLLSRILTHPCNSKPKSSTSTSSLYEKNSSKESNTALIVTLGIIAGVLAMFGLLFIIDRETFTQITGVKKIPYYCDCSKYRIDNDEDESEPTPYERDVYLTKETADYLEQKHDEEVEQPKRKFKSITRKIKNFFWCCFRPTKYEGDKYQVPWTGSEDDWEKDKLAGKEVNVIMVIFEEIRLRLCWRPTKEYDEEDKYNVDLGDNDEIKYAASSYESAEKGTAPW